MPWAERRKKKKKRKKRRKRRVTVLREVRREHR